MQGVAEPSVTVLLVKLLERPAGNPRLPTLPVDKEESDSIKKALQIAGLL